MFFENGTICFAVCNSDIQRKVYNLILITTGL